MDKKKKKKKKKKFYINIISQFWIKLNHFGCDSLALYQSSSAWLVRLYLQSLYWCQKFYLEHLILYTKYLYYYEYTKYEYYEIVAQLCTFS